MNYSTGLAKFYLKCYNTFNKFFEVKIGICWTGQNGKKNIEPKPRRVGAWIGCKFCHG